MSVKVSNITSVQKIKYHYSNIAQHVVCKAIVRFKRGAYTDIMRGQNDRCRYNGISDLLRPNVGQAY